MDLFEEQSELRPLVGAIEAVRHHNPQDGWTVARAARHRGERRGRGGDLRGLPGRGAGRAWTCKLWGQWAVHPTYGDQFRFLRYEVQRPMTAEAILRFLSGGVIKGVGPKLAETIGGGASATTRSACSRRSRSASARSRESAEEGGGDPGGVASSAGRADAQGVLMRLQGMGISSAMAIRIFNHYGRTVRCTWWNRTRISLRWRWTASDSRSRTASPAQWARRASSPFRLQAGLAFALQEAAQQGHCYPARDRPAGVCGAAAGVR